jgi:hypothetical protein
MAAIPFSLVGILPAHGLMNAFFTATSMIGFIAGAGIVVRNSIILVDFIELRLQEGMPLDEALGLFHVVGGIEQGLAAFLEGFQVVEDGVAALRVHAHGRLVEQEQLRVVEHCGGQVEAAHHAAAEPLHPVFGAFSKAYEVERRVDGATALVEVHAIERAE